LLPVRLLPETGLASDLPEIVSFRCSAGRKAAWRLGVAESASCLWSATTNTPTPSKNPSNDAKAIASTLAHLGFAGAEPRFNLDYNGRRRASGLRDRSRRRGYAVIYFAGHGVEVDGHNVLIPVDARLERSRDVYFDRLIRSGAEQRRRCAPAPADHPRRLPHNPFRARMMGSGRKRSIGQRLYSVEPGGNVLVACAAKHGTFALDERGGNSPFAER
jgi:hypothetical protein